MGWRASARAIRAAGPVLASLWLLAPVGARGPGPDEPGPVAGPSDSITAPDATAALPEPGGYRLVQTYQSTINAPLGVIDDPSGVHVAADGTVFVADRGLHRVQRFTAEGQPLGEYGRLGVDPGELVTPSGVATDLGRDRVYISDTGNARISVHRLDGGFEALWDGFKRPQAIAVAPGGMVYVYDGETGQIFLRAPDGTGDQNIVIGPFIFHDPGLASGMAVERSGDIYVAINLGVRIFASDGTQKSPFRYSSGGNLTRDVTFDAEGGIYVLEAQRLVYPVAGRQMTSMALGPEVRAIAGGPRGLLYMILPATRDRLAGVVLRRFQGGRQSELRRWGIPQTVLGWLNQPIRLAFAAHGDLYVVDALRRLQRFPRALDQALGQLLLPGLQDAVATADGDLVLVRTRYGTSEQDPEDPDLPPPGIQRLRIERYDLAAPLGPDTPEAPSPLWQVTQDADLSSADAAQVVGLAHDPLRDRSYVLDNGRRRVTAYAADGSVAASWELPALNAGLPAYADLALGPDGAVHVLHVAARRIYRYGPEGNLEAVLDTPEWPWRLAIDPSGDPVLVTARRWLWRLDPGGRMRAAVPLPDPAHGDPQPPADLDLDAAGRAYVLDQTAAAIYVLAPDAGAGPLPRPPAQGLRCSLAPRIAVEPLELEIGRPAEVRLAIEGDCEPQRRSGERPARLLQSATVSVTLPSGLRLVPPATEPPARVEGDTLTWDIADVPPEGLTLRYRVTADRSGRFPVLASGGAAFLDAWFNYGTASLPSTDFYTLLPPTPTPLPSPTPTPLPSPSPEPSPTPGSGPLFLPALGRQAGP